MFSLAMDLYHVGLRCIFKVVTDFFLAMFHEMRESTQCKRRRRLLQGNSVRQSTPVIEDAFRNIPDNIQ